MTTASNHTPECLCDACKRWRAMVGNGRCARCQQPIDEHNTTTDGRITNCPAKKG